MVWNGLMLENIFTPILKLIDSVLIILTLLYHKNNKKNNSNNPKPQQIPQKEYQKQVLNYNNNKYSFKLFIYILYLDLDKKQIEIQKLLDEEINEMNTLFKKTGQHLYIHGDHFITCDTINVQFIFDNKATTVPGYYKNGK